MNMAWKPKLQLCSLRPIESVFPSHKEKTKNLLWSFKEGVERLPPRVGTGARGELDEKNSFGLRISPKCSARITKQSERPNGYQNNLAKTQCSQCNVSQTSPRLPGQMKQATIKNRKLHEIRMQDLKKWLQKISKASPRKYYGEKEHQIIQQLLCPRPAGKRLGIVGTSRNCPHTLCTSQSPSTLYSQKTDLANRGFSHTTKLPMKSRMKFDLKLLLNIKRTQPYFGAISKTAFNKSDLVTSRPQRKYSSESTNTVIEKDCDNDYSLIMESLNSVRATDQL